MFGWLCHGENTNKKILQDAENSLLNNPWRSCDSTHIFFAQRVWYDEVNNHKKSAVS